MKLSSIIYMMIVLALFSRVNVSIADKSTTDSNQQKPVIHRIEIKNFSFVPNHIDVSKGDKIIWINQDDFPHNIVDSSEDKILSQTLNKGDEFNYIVDIDLNYECGFHPSMTGKIKISSQ